MNKLSELTNKQKLMVLARRLTFSEKREFVQLVLIPICAVCDSSKMEFLKYKTLQRYSKLLAIGTSFIPVLCLSRKGMVIWMHINY